jgi:hypothetical protein
VKTLAYFECQYIRTFWGKEHCILESTARKNCRAIPSLGAEIWDEHLNVKLLLCVTLDLKSYIRVSHVGWTTCLQTNISTPKVFKILDANPTIHGFRGTVVSRSLMNAVVARFAHRVQNIPPNSVSQLFPLSVVFSAVSPSSLRSFLPMCFRVGSVLRLLLSVSRSLV